MLWWEKKSHTSRFWAIWKRTLTHRPCPARWSLAGWKEEPTCVWHICCSWFSHLSIVFSSPETSCLFRLQVCEQGLVTILCLYTSCIVATFFKVLPLHILTILACYTVQTASFLSPSDCSPEMPLFSAISSPVRYPSAPIQDQFVFLIAKAAPLTMILWDTDKAWQLAQFSFLRISASFLKNANF